MSFFSTHASFDLNPPTPSSQTFFNPNFLNSGTASFDILPFPIIAETGNGHNDSNWVSFVDLSPTLIGFDTSFVDEAHEAPITPKVATKRNAPIAPQKANSAYSPVRGLGAKKKYDRKQYGFLPGVLRENIPLPNMEITAAEILCFLPDHIHRPAVAAHLVGKGFTGKAVADLVNYFRHVPQDAEYRLKDNTVTKIFTNTLATAFDNKDWRKNVECMAKVSEMSSDMTTSNWAWKYVPKSSGGLLLRTNDEMKITDVCKELDYTQFPRGSGAHKLTNAVLWVLGKMKDGELDRSPLLSDLPTIIRLMEEETEPVGSLVANVDEELLGFWKSGKNSLFGKGGVECGSTGKDKKGMRVSARYQPYRQVL